MARPSPSSRSGARRISLRAMCPQITATMLPRVLVWRGMAFMVVSSEVELDALRQRQEVGVVDGIRLSAHIGLPCIAAGLAAAAGLLLATERAADLGAAGAAVDVGDAA